MMIFRKMHGLGNDFVILDGRKTPIPLTPQDIQGMSDRRRGVGCDQFIVMEPSRTADVFMRIYNPDGSEAGACGNATRCIADIILTETGRDQCVVETISGHLVSRRVAVGLIEVDMGEPRLLWDQIPVAKEMDTLHLPLAGDPVAVNMGNPHCVFFVDNLDQVDVATRGASVEKDLLFPQKTNVEFVQILSRTHVRMRVWERGAGITQACGSGACAVGVAAIRRGLTDRDMTVTLDGGDLRIHWRETDGHVLMTGAITYVFEGRFF
jgi:diaminopimelate epimerase